MLRVAQRDGAWYCVLVGMGSSEFTSRSFMTLTHGAIRTFGSGCNVGQSRRWRVLGRRFIVEILFFHPGERVAGLTKNSPLTVSTKEALPGNGLVWSFGSPKGPFGFVSIRGMRVWSSQQRRVVRILDASPE